GQQRASLPPEAFRLLALQTHRGKSRGNKDEQLPFRFLDLTKAGLVGLNDPSKVPRSRHHLFPLWLACTNLQRIGNHINIFKTGAGIKKYNLVCWFEESLLHQHLV